MSEANDAAARARLAQTIAGVRDRFVARFDERIAELLALVGKATLPDGAAARATLRLRLHNISGSAPTIGLVELGARAAAIEADLMAAREGLLDEQVASSLSKQIMALSADRGELLHPNQ